MRLIATLLLLAISGPLLAQSLSYNYIEGSWSITELDVGDSDVDGDGFGLYGSVEVGTMWHVFANFTRSSLDDNVDYDQTWIGGGLHTPLAPNMDLYFNLAYVNVEADGLGGALDDDGLGTALGVRMMLRPQIEVSGALSYSELGDNSTTGIEGKAWYYFTRNLAVGGGVGFEDDLIRYGIGVRYYWD
jgi:hypothetical protein